MFHYTWNLELILKFDIKGIREIDLSNDHVILDFT